MMTESATAAFALVILLGSVVMQMYLPTVAAAQGNSITGLFSVIGYIFIFFIIMNTVIQGLFHLTSELADDAIGWVGGIGRQNIGKDTEGKVNNRRLAITRLASPNKPSFCAWFFGRRRSALAPKVGLDLPEDRPEVQVSRRFPVGVASPCSALAGRHRSRTCRPVTPCPDDGLPQPANSCDVGKSALRQRD